MKSGPSTEYFPRYIITGHKNSDKICSDLPPVDLLKGLMDSELRVLDSDFAPTPFSVKRITKRGLQVRVISSQHTLSTMEIFKALLVTSGISCSKIYPAVTWFGTHHRVLPFCEFGVDIFNNLLFLESRLRKKYN